MLSIKVALLVNGRSLDWDVAPIYCADNIWYFCFLRKRINYIAELIKRGKFYISLLDANIVSQNSCVYVSAEDSPIPNVILIDR